MADAASKGGPSSGRFWALLPVVLLGATAIAMVFVVSVALDDKGFSVERDYYKKAVAYDAELTQRRHNGELGWQLSAEPNIGTRNALILAHLFDRNHQPISGATVTGEAFAVARGQRIEQLSFTENQAGSYEAPIARGRPGLWELRLTATLGPDRFTKVIRTDVTPRRD
ncbi:MAG TPA: FixH family protein [Polyangiaceae bacterium]